LSMEVRSLERRIEIDITNLRNPNRVRANAKSN
jgi:hypothetical protein